jgi:DNA-binding MarR family transcriptional regulator
MAVLGRFFKEPPNLYNLGEAMGTSYQNVKEISKRLHEKGLIIMERDSKDKRNIRVSLTKKCHKLWESRFLKDKEFFEKLFTNFNEKEITIFLDYLTRMVKTIKNIEGEK